MSRIFVSVSTSSLFTICTVISAVSILAHIVVRYAGIEVFCDSYECTKFDTALFNQYAGTYMTRHY
jgi:hypothetical protein